jgi:hypothetical protein
MLTPKSHLDILPFPRYSASQGSLSPRREGLQVSVFFASPPSLSGYPLYTSLLINRWISELFFVFDTISHEAAEYE